MYRRPRVGGNPPEASHTISFLRLQDEKQDQQDRHHESERRFLAVPAGGLPHREPFAGDDQEADEPDQESDEATDEDRDLRSSEFRHAPLARPPQGERPISERETRGRLAQD